MFSSLPGFQGFLPSLPGTLYCGFLFALSPLVPPYWFCLVPVPPFLTLHSFVASFPTPPLVVDEFWIVVVFCVVYACCVSGFLGSCCPEPVFLSSSFHYLLLPRYLLFFSLPLLTHTRPPPLIFFSVNSLVSSSMVLFSTLVPSQL